MGCACRIFGWRCSRSRMSPRAEQLIAIQREKLEALHAELAGLIRKNDYRYMKEEIWEGRRFLVAGCGNAGWQYEVEPVKEGKQYSPNPNTRRTRGGYFL